MKNSPMAKDEYIGFRTSAETKQILQKLADEGYRTLSQQCDMIVIQWLKQQGHVQEKNPKT